MSELAGELLAMLAATLYATNSIFVALARREVSHEQGLFLSTLGNVTVAVAAVGAEAVFWRPPSVSWPAAGVFALAGLLTSFTGRFLWIKSVHLSGPGRATSLSVAQPVFTITIAVLFLGEALTGHLVAGAALVLAGVWLLSASGTRIRLPGGPPAQGGKPGETARPVTGTSEAAAIQGTAQLAALRTGVLAGVGSSLAFGLGNVARKAGLLLLPEPFVGALIGATCASLPFLALSAAQGRLAAFLRIPRRRGALLYLLSGITSGLAQVILFLSLNVIPVSINNVLYSTQPLYAIPLSYWLLKNEEGLNRAAVVAALLIVAGAVVLAWHQATP